MYRHLASFSTVVVLMNALAGDAVAQQWGAPQPMRSNSYQANTPQAAQYQKAPQPAAVFQTSPVSPVPLTGTSANRNGVASQAVTPQANLANSDNASPTPMPPQASTQSPMDRSADSKRLSQDADPLRPRSRVTNPQLQNVPNSANLSHVGEVRDIHWEPNYRFEPKYRDWQNMAAPQGNSFGYLTPPYYQAPVSQGYLAPNTYFGPESLSWSNVFPTTVTPHYGGGWNSTPW